MDTLQKLQGRIPAGEPSGAPEAGVLVGVIDSPSPRLIYTLRAASMNTHSGEVAFPGGKREQIDDDIWETALRESNEEIGLEIQTASKIGQLDRFTSRFGLEVTPCVALVSDQHWQAAANEVAAVFTMPIERLLHDEPDSVDHFHKEGQEMFVPRWRSAEGMEIWGLTARITVEFLRQACGDQRTLTNW